MFGQHVHSMYLALKVSRAQVVDSMPPTCCVPRCLAVHVVELTTTDDDLDLRLGIALLSTNKLLAACATLEPMT